MKEVLLAIVAEGRSGRVYVDPALQPDVDLGTLPDVASAIPTESLPHGGLGFRVQNYGVECWSQLFTTRQLLVLATFSNLLPLVRQRIERDAVALGFPKDDRHFHEGGAGITAYSDAVITYLAFVMDKCADFWSTVCSWNSTGEKMRQTFARQAIPMTWDFAETNPFSSSTGNWGSMVEWEKKAIEALPLPLNAASTAQRDATARIAEVGKAMICTDPPYYDNVGYADLSDFFYVWLRRNVCDIWPEECATVLTPKDDELVADASRTGSQESAKVHFESGMRTVFEQAARYTDDRFPATVFYAFKAAESSEGGVISTGWETFLAGLLDAGYAISATWPIRTEKPGRTRAIGSAALASSIVLACRQRRVEAPMATRGEFIACLRTEMAPAVRILQAGNIAPVDLAQSAIGPGIAIFSRYAKVVEADGSSMSVRTALGQINEILAEILNGEESEFDSDTRFALTWFEQYAHTPGPFGDAGLLARAKDTTVRVPR